MTTTLYLIRHAETVWNRQGRVQGFQDSELSEKGIEQSQQLSDLFQDKKFDAAYSSDAGRCLETAKYALKGTSLELQVLQSLRERNLGDWEGRVFTEVIKKDPQGTQAYRDDPQYSPPNGETFLDMQDRVFPSIEEMVKKHEGKRIVIFTSGGSLRSIVMKAVKADPRSWSSWATWNTGVTTIEIKKDLWRLVRFNDISHLKQNSHAGAIF